MMIVIIIFIIIVYIRETIWERFSFLYYSPIVFTHEIFINVLSEEEQEKGPG